MAVPIDFYIKRNDTRPAIRATLSAASIDVFTSVKFFMYDSTGTAKVAGVTATIITQPSSSSGGVVQYQWNGAAGDTDTAGEYDAEFQVTFDDGRKETYPNNGFIKVHIGPDLGD